MSRHLGKRLAHFSLGGKGGGRSAMCVGHLHSKFERAGRSSLAFFPKEERPSSAPAGRPCCAPRGCCCPGLLVLRGGGGRGCPFLLPKTLTGLDTSSLDIFGERACVLRASSSGSFFGWVSWPWGQQNICGRISTTHLGRAPSPHAPPPRTSGLASTHPPFSKSGNRCERRPIQLHAHPSTTNPPTPTPFKPSPTHPTHAHTQPPPPPPHLNPSHVPHDRRRPGLCRPGRRHPCPRGRQGRGHAGHHQRGPRRSQEGRAQGPVRPRDRGPEHPLLCQFGVLEPVQAPHGHPRGHADQGRCLGHRRR